MGVVSLLENRVNIFFLVLKDVMVWMLLMVFVVIMLVCVCVFVMLFEKFLRNICFMMVVKIWSGNVVSIMSVMFYWRVNVMM